MCWEVVTLKESVLQRHPGSCRTLHPEGRQEENSPSSGVRCPWGWEGMQEEDRRACSDIDASTVWWAGGPCLVFHFAAPPSCWHHRL